jgi:phospholipid/cholesterol/gamma-HCH transport system substrate-binding protein
VCVVSSSSKPDDRLRTGLFGVILITSVVLVSFGYPSVPFFPQGKTYTAYFGNAAGLTPNNDVVVYGQTVGKVTTVELADVGARVGFTVDRGIRLGDQSLAAIRTDTVLGQRSIAITPAGAGSVATIPANRTTTPYTLSSALQDLGRNAGAIDKKRFTQALGVLTDALHDATPQLRGALEGVTALSRSVNARDEQVGQLLGHAQSVSAILAKRAGQLNRLIDDGNSLFGELQTRRQALGELIAGIDDVAQQISGFVADNRQQFGPALHELNVVLDNLNSHREKLSAALTQLPRFATTLGEVVGSGPGFTVNVYGVPWSAASGALLDSNFQPGQLPETLADFLRGMISQRLIVRPKSP